MNAKKCIGSAWLLSLALSLASSAAFAAAPVSVSVDLRLDEVNYVIGERVRGVISVGNMLPEQLSVGYPDSEDRLIVELFKASDGDQIERTNERPFVSSFMLKANEGIKLEVFIGDHYDFSYESRFFARAVLVHAGMRYESSLRAFDVLPGFAVSSAVQMFSNAPGLARHFELRRWMRRGTDHLFLSAADEGTRERRWTTYDVGTVVRSTPPTISILPSGEVLVLHRNGPDSFCRSSFWSLPDELVLRERQAVRDPETAAQQGVQEVYRKTGGVKAADRPWWKFW